MMKSGLEYGLKINVDSHVETQIFLDNNSYL